MGRTKKGNANADRNNNVKFKQGFQTNEELVEFSTGRDKDREKTPKD